MNWFSNITDKSKLKSEFRALALQYHPDHGGDAAIMREIIQQYEKLRRELPASAFRKNRNTADIMEAAARLATPVFAHRDFCLMAKVLFVYGGLGKKSAFAGFYRQFCEWVDPGAEKYADYHIDRKIGARVLKEIREKILRRAFYPELWKIFRRAQAELAR